MEDKIEDIDTSVKENIKAKKFLHKTSRKIVERIMKRPDLRIIEIEEGKQSQIQGPTQRKR